tara:strand:- start:23 stop:214 length:192 start_codon:yes stop_codon:yes gene_type:complete
MDNISLKVMQGILTLYSKGNRVEDVFQLLSKHRMKLSKAEKEVFRDKYANKSSKENLSNLNSG